MIVARSSTPSCLVAMLEQYYVSAELSKNSKLRLFRDNVVIKSGKGLCSQGYTRLRDLFLARLLELGFDKK